VSAAGPALVLLAAGASRRLGTCKALVDLEGRTPLARLLAAGACLDAAPPLVVAGPDADAIAAALPAGCELARNEVWSAGRSGSARLAAELRPGLDLALAPVDVPLVPAEVFAALREAWLAAGSPPHGWLAPRARDAAGVWRHGHPVLLGRALARGLADLPPERPLRSLREAAAPLWSIPVAGLEILDDLDDPEDLERLRRRLRRDS
jgi:molybdenum cofactor cytidylyltransferase